MRARVISTACMRMPSRGVYVYAREPHTRAYNRTNQPNQMNLCIESYQPEREVVTQCVPSAYALL